MTKTKVLIAALFTIVACQGPENQPNQTTETSQAAVTLSYDSPWVNRHSNAAVFYDVGTGHNWVMWCWFADAGSTPPTNPLWTDLGAGNLTATVTQIWGAGSGSSFVVMPDNTTAGCNGQLWTTQAPHQGGHPLEIHAGHNYTDPSSEYMQCFGNNSGAISLYGNGGDDKLEGFNPSCHIFGGPGNDKIIVHTAGEAIDGEDGNDCIDTMGLTQNIEACGPGNSDSSSSVPRPADCENFVNQGSCN